MSRSYTGLSEAVRGIPFCANEVKIKACSPLLIPRKEKQAIFV